jgi:hypothetical protein
VRGIEVVALEVDPESSAAWPKAEDLVILLLWQLASQLVGLLVRIWAGALI